jgi:hypothetical protein
MPALFHEAWRRHEEIPLFGTDETILNVIVDLIKKL